MVNQIDVFMPAMNNKCSPLVEESLCLAAIVMMLFTVAYINLDWDNGDDNVEGEGVTPGNSWSQVAAPGHNAASSSGTGSIRTNKSTATAETYLGDGEIQGGATTRGVVSVDTKVRGPALEISLLGGYVG